MKKILLFLAICVSFFSVNSVFADVDEFEDLNNRYQKEEYLSPEELNKLNEYQSQYGVGDEGVEKMRAIENREEECTTGTNAGNCIDQESYMFDTVKMFGLGNETRKTNSEESANLLLGTLIQKLMVALGILSVLIMTIGGGYIVMYHGQDELLSKGKSIFNAGIIALVVALSSYMLVGLLRFILYN